MLPSSKQNQMSLNDLGSEMLPGPRTFCYVLKKKKTQKTSLCYNTFVDFLDDISTYVFVNP